MDTETKRQLVRAAITKTAKHRIGLPPYESWKRFVAELQSRNTEESPTGKTEEDIVHAIKEVRGYAATSTAHANGLKDLRGRLAALLKTHQSQRQDARIFDGEIDAVRKALAKVNQL